MKKLFFLLLLFLFGQGSLFGQDYAVRHFSVSDGLPSGNLTNLYQDNRGYLWVSTIAGISRFDGHEFKNFSLREGLPFSYASDICEDPAGNLYINYGSGVARFDGQTFKNFPCKADGRELALRDLVPQKDGSLLVVTAQALLTLRGDSLHLHPNPEKRTFYCGKKNAEGRVFIGGTDGIYTWKNESLKPFIVEKGERVQSLHFASDSCLWYGLLHNKLRRFPMHKKGAPVEKMEMPNLAEGFAGAFLQSDERRVYVATQQGILIYEQGKFIKAITSFFTVPSDAINALKIDTEGNIWVGSLFGLWRLSQAFTYHYPSNSIIAKNLYAIDCVAKDSVIFTDGFYMYAANRSEIFPILEDKPSLGSEMYDILSTPNGNTYFGTGLTGLMQHDSIGKYTKYNFGSGPFYRSNVLAQRHGLIYIGASNGYHIWDGKRVQSHKPKELETQNVLSMWADDDFLLLGTNHGLYKSNAKGEVEYLYELTDSIEVVIADIFRKGNSLYLGTKGMGLILAHYAEGKIIRDTILSQASGLPSDYIASTIVDKQGQIWVTTLQGLSKVVRLSKSAYYVRNYGPNQGVPDAFWESCKFELDPQTGSIWIGNSEGLIRIEPEKENSSITIPIIHVEQVIMRNILHPRNKADIRLFRPLEDSIYSIPFALNDVQIQLNAVLLSGAEELEYWYKIQGIKDDWVLAPINGIIELNNLAPGEYRLLVSAFNRSNKTFSKEKGLLLHVERPFWMSGWFYFLIINCFLGLVYAFFKWRVHQALKKQNAAMIVNKQLSESRYLAFQARMNPHFIFNSLNSIQYFITQNDKKSSLTYLSKFARLLRQVLDNTKAIKVPLNEEMDMLKNYLEMEFMRFDGHFTYSFELDDALKDCQYEIPGMLLQPFVENAIVHGLLHLKSGEGSLQIKLKKEGDFILCTIIDNGVGRENANQINARRKPNHKSHGLEIASNRLKLLMENIPIEELIRVSDPETGSGTVVKIKLPIL